MPLISSFQLKLSYWFLTSKKELKKWFNFLLLVIDVFILIVLLVNILVYFLTLGKESQMMTSFLMNPVKFDDYYRPPSLSLGKSIIILQEENKHDLVAKVSNPNQKWAVKNLSYYFQVDGIDQEKKETFIMPQKETYLLEVGLEFSGSSIPQKAELKIKEVEWQKIKDINNFPQVEFKVEEVAMSPVIVQDPQTEKSTVVNQVRGQIINNSVYNFWEVGATVVLLSGEKVEYAKKIYFSEFLSFESRNFEILVSKDLAPISKIVVETEVDLLDLENFIK